ncbi:hypothetical protein [Dactylosporangium matsuzakiense]|uniref:hypothetical protein n=1 Tax=Dactylosporangium matsuzakiense TaxID=53360 RepID=UPI0021C4BE80|nr:hypothetical protein [Dactylosporangium matsuzakiense]UWZ46128.1 hypothetical protein Dmats_06650 [Dactylosporangium matsuzakiense]
MTAEQQEGFEPRPWSTKLRRLFGVRAGPTFTVVSDHGHLQTVNAIMIVTIVGPMTTAVTALSTPFIQKSHRRPQRLQAPMWTAAIACR